MSPKIAFLDIIIAYNKFKKQSLSVQELYIPLFTFYSLCLFIFRFYGSYTLDVIARCAFATRLDSHSDETNEFVTKARQAFSGKVTLPLILLCK